MAQKRPTPVNEAPASLEEEEETSSSEEEEVGTESESESESEDVASKPMEKTSTKSVNSKPKSSSSTAVEKASSKWGSEVEKDEKHSKRLKTKDSESKGALEKAEDTKKPLFQRVWSEDDEVALLKGVIAFTEEKGIDYVEDMNAFHDFIKKSLHFVVNLSQLRDKAWRLKKKFKNLVSKGKEGENKTFSRQHEQTLFDLSKKIWGSESKSKVELKTEAKRGMVEFNKGVRMETMEDYVRKRGLEMVDEAKKSEMEEKWSKLHVAELELFVKHKELMAEQGKLLLASYKRSV